MGQNTLTHEKGHGRRIPHTMGFSSVAEYPQDRERCIREGRDRAMDRTAFSPDEIEILRHAIEIAEDLIGNHYKISTSDWKRYRYDIQSLKDLREDEVTDYAFAQVRRYARRPDEKTLASRHGEFFKVCLQDHVIRHAVHRDPLIELFPLSTYIVVHELIHVVRFARFEQRFDVSEKERKREEKRVHELTFQLLTTIKLNGMDQVLSAFNDCRTMETFVTDTHFG